MRLTQPFPFNIRNLPGALCSYLLRRRRVFLRQFSFSLFLATALAFGAAAQSANQQVPALIHNGESALDRGNFAEAISDFQQAHEIAPESIAASRGLVLSYLQAGRLKEAQALGESASARWPRDAELQHWLGLAYFKDGQDGKALETLQKSEALDGSTFAIHFDTALVLLSENQYPAAAEELEKALRLDSKSALAHVLLGRAYQNTNRSVQAIDEFRTALQLEPELPLGHYHLGFAYASLGRDREAIAEYEKELLHSPNDSLVRYQLGHCLLETGEWKSAAVQLKKATEINPQNFDAFYDLGKALVLLDDLDGAVAALRRAAELKPESASPHYQLARALEKAGHMEESRQEFQTFATLKKAEPASGGMAAGPIQ
jgi:tetratricopeptide (TPR) repeat protein